MKNNNNRFVPMIVAAVKKPLSLSAYSLLRKNGADIVEFRFDCFDELSPEILFNCFSKAKKAGLKTLGTFRSSKEGGEGHLNEAQRLAIYESMLPEADFVDIELSSAKILTSIRNDLSDHQTKLILSYHNFRETPSEARLDQILKECSACSYSFIKIAVFPKSQEDVKTMLKWTLRHPEVPLITICMGPLGQLSRIFFPSAGSRFTYTYEGQATAPGQLGLKQTKELIDLFYRS